MSFLTCVTLEKLLNHSGFYFPDFKKEGGVIKDIHQGCSKDFFLSMTVPITMINM